MKTTWRSVIAVVGVMGLTAGWCAAQSNITLQAVGDTSIWEHNDTANRSVNPLDVASIPTVGTTTGMQMISYIRFDTGVLEAAPEAGAVLTIYRTVASEPWNEGDMLLYGLPDIVGNTTQAWGTGATLFYSTAGDEIPADLDPGTQDINTNNLVFLGNIPGSAGAITEPAPVTFASGALDDFLGERFAGGGATTFLLVSAEDLNVAMQVQNTETAFPPVLEVVGTLRPPDEEEGILLTVDADAAVQSQSPDATRANGPNLLARNLADPYREWLTYLRFNLATSGPPQYVTLILAGALDSGRDARFADADANPLQPATLRIFPESSTGTVFSIYRSGGATWAEGQLQMWGLLNVAGNTPAEWDEPTLTYNLTGAEVAKPAAPGLDRTGERTMYLGDLPASPNDGEAVLFSSAALDNFLFGGGAAATLTDIAFDGEDIVVAWDGVAGHIYDIERSANSVTDWMAVVTNLTGEATNVFTDPAPEADIAVYRVVDQGAPPPQTFLEEDFESGAPGWVVVTGATHAGGTTWEIGSPTAGIGPPGAQEGEACAGINLAGFYTSNADVGLQSPVLDLTSAGAVALSFGHWYGLDGVADFCRVYIRDANGDEIPELAAPIGEYSGLFTTAWTPVNLAMPAEAVGRTIRIEFRFTSDASENWEGWYIDNVRVSE